MYRTFKHFVPVYSVPVRHGNQVLRTRQLSWLGWGSKAKEDFQKQEVPDEKAVAKRVADDTPSWGSKAKEGFQKQEVKLKEVPDEKAVAKGVADDTPPVVALPEDSQGIYLDTINELSKYANKYYPHILTVGGSIIGGRFIGKVVSDGLRESIVEIVKGVPMKGRRLFSTGDTIRVDNVQGRVVDIRLTGVVLASKEGEIHLANSKFLIHNVVNLGRPTDLLDKFEVVPPTLSLQAEMKKLQEEILQLKAKVGSLEKFQEEEESDPESVVSDIVGPNEDDALTDSGTGKQEDGVTEKRSHNGGDH